MALILENTLIPCCQDAVHSTPAGPAQNPTSVENPTRLRTTTVFMRTSPLSRRSSTTPLHIDKDDFHLNLYQFERHLSATQDNLRRSASSIISTEIRSIFQNATSNPFMAGDAGLLRSDGTDC